MPTLMSPTEQRINELIKMLVRGTNQNLLKWQVTADEESFRLASPAANVRITRSEGYSADVPEGYVSRQLSILNDKSRVIEELTPKTSIEAEEFDSLFIDARRSAYQTDHVLDKLMNDLRASGVTS